MKNGVIFDMDGTIWDTTSLVVPAWNIVLKRYNVKQITVKDMQGFMGKTLENIASIILPEMHVEDRMRIMSECCLEEQSYLRSNGGILYPEFERTLKKLKEKYSLYIVSNCHQKYIESFFAYHKLSDYFSDVECHGRTGLSKGENIKRVIERNNLDRAVYIGDTQSDLDASDYAGIPFIYAEYGFGTVNRQVPSVKNPAQLIYTVEKILNEYLS